MAAETWGVGTVEKRKGEIIVAFYFFVNNDYLFGSKI